MPAQLGIDEKLEFGKHRGKMVVELIGKDPGYLLFLRRPSEKSKSGMAMTKELHMALDSLLYSNPSLGERGKNLPRYSKDEVDLFMVELEGAAARVSAKAEAITVTRLDAYEGLWGAWA